MSMLLFVDAGNTRIKWALADQGASLGKWLMSGSVLREHVEQLEEAWRHLGMSGALVSNVAGAAIRTGLERVLRAIPAAKALPIDWFVSQPALAGIRNGYRQPQQLGSDRFASAIGGHALFPDCHLIIATCGTATTIDAVTAEGQFTGGMILPGLSLMSSSLARGTAQLPEVLQQSAGMSLFADNTEAAIINGCIAAQTGAIQRAYTIFTHMHPLQTVQCIISGGASASIAAQLAIPCIHVDNLVLLGLQAAVHQQSHTSTC